MKTQLIHCDFCGKEQQEFPNHWEQKIAEITIHCPQDGINLSKSKFDACWNCRKKINDVIDSLTSFRGPLQMGDWK